MPLSYISVRTTHAILIDLSWKRFWMFFFTQGGQGTTWPSRIRIPSLISSSRWKKVSSSSLDDHFYLRFRKWNKDNELIRFVVTDFHQQRPLFLGAPLGTYPSHRLIVLRDVERIDHWIAAKLEVWMRLRTENHHNNAQDIEIEVRPSIDPLLMHLFHF